MMNNIKNNQMDYKMEIIDKSSAEQLKTIVNRLEKLEDDKTEITDQIKEVLTEAKGNGFDPQTIRTIIKIRKMKLTDLETQEALLDMYKVALGMVKND